MYNRYSRMRRSTSSFVSGVARFKVDIVVKRLYARSDWKKRLKGKLRRERVRSVRHKNPRWDVMEMWLRGWRLALRGAKE
jgi:hypothetical protein